MIKQDIARVTPKKGVNVCGYDDDEQVGQRYYLIKNFVDGKQAAVWAAKRAKEEPDEEVVIVDGTGALTVVGAKPKPVAPAPEEE